MHPVQKLANGFLWLGAMGRMMWIPVYLYMLLYGTLTSIFFTFFFFIQFFPFLVYNRNNNIHIASYPLHNSFSYHRIIYIFRPKMLSPYLSLSLYLKALACSFTSRKPVQTFYAPKLPPLLYTVGD